MPTLPHRDWKASSLLKNLAEATGVPGKHSLLGWEATSEAQDTVALPLRCPRHCLPGELRICFSTSS
jgi:hypothetical protein